MSIRHLQRAAAAASALAVAASVVVLGGIAPAPVGAATPASVSLAVPAYFTDDALWEKVVAIPEVGYVIGHPLAPEAGKAYKADPELGAHLALAKSKGKTTLVYVTGGYDKIDWKVVADRIQTVLDAYPQADGVFIDEINYDQCAKYSSLTKGAAGAAGVRTRFPNKLIVLNPGAPILNCYEGLADGYVTMERAEKDISAWSANVNLPGNASAYAWMFTPANRPKMWEMVHSVTPAGAAAAVDAAVARNASVLYLTSDVMPNPYDSLPAEAFLSALTDRVASYASGKTALPVVPQLTTTTAPKTATAQKAAAVKKTVKKTVRKRTTKKK